MNITDHNKRQESALKQFTAKPDRDQSTSRISKKKCHVQGSSKSLGNSYGKKVSLNCNPQS